MSSAVNSALDGPDDETPGPCGCYACEKRADCDYCEECNPEGFDDDYPHP